MDPYKLHFNWWEISTQISRKTILYQTIKSRLVSRLISIDQLILLKSHKK